MHEVVYNGEGGLPKGVELKRMEGQIRTIGGC